MSRATDLRAQILELVRDYHTEAFPVRDFVPGQTPIPVSGKVFDGDEMSSLVDSGLDFWLTTGRCVREYVADPAGAMAGIASPA